MVQDAGLVPAPILTGAENMDPADIWSQDRQPIASRHTDWAIPVHMYV
jgi:hypothetical protein